MTHLGILIGALLIDAALGDPDWVWRKIPHPAALMGRVISAFERVFNTGSAKRLKGALVISALTFMAAATGFLVVLIPDYGVLELLLTAVLLATNSLTQHVGAVATGLKASLTDGQKAVALIVGRDPTALDHNGVVRSAIESAAENFSDGVIAPAFWFLLAGLPGIMVYKMVNTADSMIGYRTTRYQEFGWAAARLDDLMNWVPARLTGLLICGTHFSRSAFAIMRRDAPLHRSPNAGWPEAAAAAVLGVAISGPRIYAGRKTDDPFVNADGRYDLTPADITAAVSVVWRGWGGFVLMLTLMWLLAR